MRKTYSMSYKIKTNKSDQENIPDKDLEALLKWIQV